MHSEGLGEAMRESELRDKIEALERRIAVLEVSQRGVQFKWQPVDATLPARIAPQTT